MFLEVELFECILRLQEKRRVRIIVIIVIVISIKEAQ